MNPTLRAAMLAAIVTASLPTITAGQAATIDGLVRRIELLERQVVQLQQRVQSLESNTKAEPTRDRPVSDARKWQELANWRLLKRGMSMEKVRELLGEPERVEATAWTIWYWSDRAAEVRFDAQSGKVDGWSEPKR